MRKIKGFFIGRTTLSRSPRTAHCSLLIALCSLLTVLLSCKSTPVPKVAQLAEIGEYIPLDKGASVYVIADAKEARPLIDLLPIEELKNKQVKQMIDLTDFFVAALFDKSSGKRFQIVSQGSYPSGGAAIALGFSKDWESRRSDAGHSYWLSKNDRLSIAITSTRAYIKASLNDESGDPVSASPGVKVPDGYLAFMNNAGEKKFPISFWLDDGGSVINKALGTGSFIRIPVQNVFIAFFPADGDKYKSKIRMQFENAAQARSMANMLSMANNYIFGELGGKAMITSVFFANPPVVNENNLDIITAPLKESEISLLLRMFLL